MDIILIPLHCFFQLRPVLVQLDDLPLLVLHKADGREDNLQDALVLRLVVLVQPQVIHEQEQVLEHPSPDQVQERPGLAHDIQHFTLHHALTSCIYGVELGTGGTVILHIPACLTFPAAVLRAHILWLPLVAHTLGRHSWRNWYLTHPIYQFITFHTDSTVIGEHTSHTLLRTVVLDKQGLIEYSEGAVRVVLGHNGWKYKGPKYLSVHFNKGITLKLVLVEGFIHIIDPDGGEVVGDAA